MRFSVIIPCYNDGVFAIEAIDSCLQQAAGIDLEILFVDDGSRDGSFDLISMRYLGEERVKLFHKPNEGLASARNFGLSRASGDYIVFLDSDDKLGSCYLARAIESIESGQAFDANGADLIILPFKYFDPSGTLSGRRFFLKFLVPPFFGEKAALNLLMILIGNVIPVSSCVVSRNLISAVGPFDTQLRSHEDWDFWIKAMMTRPKVIYAPHDVSAATLIRIRAGMTTNSEVMQKTKEQVRERYCQTFPVSLLKNRLAWALAISLRTGYALLQTGVRGRRVNLT